MVHIVVAVAAWPCGLAVLTAVVLLGLAGCGKKSGFERIKVFPARGAIKLVGQDVEGALVVFHPADGAKTGYPNPRGKAAKDGSFKIGTYDAADALRRVTTW